MNVDFDPFSFVRFTPDSDQADIEQMGHEEKSKALLNQLVSA
jgi:hypothetical protein